ncbi:enoyl-CoA hydratase-related protein (plasmid) [Polaromonas sp. P1-6]|nr:enoyl-CoA hydratase-related protein [Polaromonas sp. P1-6]
MTPRSSTASPLIGASLDCATSWQLPRCAGLRKALEIALLCEPIDADEALRLGLVNRVVAADRLAEEVDVMARKLAHGPPLALAHLKRLLRQADQHDLHSQLSIRSGKPTIDFPILFIPSAAEA